MRDIVQKLRAIAKDKASRSNFARASYCAGRAGCDDLKNQHDEPKDFLEWKAADEIERLERLNQQTVRRGDRLESCGTCGLKRVPSRYL